eukprot:231996_1
MDSPQSKSNSPRRKRRVPGPAGNLYFDLKHQKELQETEEKQEQESNSLHLSNSISSIHSISIHKIPLNIPDFWRGPFITCCFENRIKIMEDNGKLYLIRGDQSYAFKDNLASIQHNQIEHVFKVKELMIVLSKLNVFDDAIAEALDPFGTIKATLTHKVLRDFNDIRAGSCLVLENCTVYQSSHYDFYLNITTNNISRVYPNHTSLDSLPSNLKSVLKKFHKKLGIKSSSQKKRANNKAKQCRKDKMDEPMSAHRDLFYGKVQHIKKRRYSDIVDTPWLVINDNTLKQPPKKRRKISDNSAQNKHGTSTENVDTNDENRAVIEHNESDDSEDMVILPANDGNEKDEDQPIMNKSDDDDDAVIKELDMNETPRGPKTVNAIVCRDEAKKTVDKSKEKSKSPSRWSEHYEDDALNVNNNTTNRINTNQMNIFDNLEDVSIPKDHNIMSGLFSQMEEGFVFGDD